jgi:hypothetical protein
MILYIWYRPLRTLGGELGYDLREDPFFMATVHEADVTRGGV